jgi:hypothetical protein
VTLDVSLSSRAGAGAAVAISASGPALKGASIDLMPALAAACNTTPLALATTWQGNGKSLFVACQATNPHITAVGLVSALIAHVAPTLDAEVNSGAISSAQEISCLAGLRDQLTHLLDGSMSLIHAGASTRAEFQQP